MWRSEESYFSGLCLRKVGYFVMENASKALLMAGGILIAIIVIGALLLMINQVGNLQNSQDSGKKDSQLVAFNLDFERYTDDKGILGTDVISVINKVLDYNEKVKSGGVNNSVDYGIKMSVHVTGFDRFNDKYAYTRLSPNSKIFRSTTGEYTIGYGGSNEILNELKQYEKLEKDMMNKPDLVKKLSSMYDSKNHDKSIEKMEDYLYRYGLNYDLNSDNLKIIEKYKQYSEFKSSTFRSSQQPIYENGQIKELFFDFVK